MWFKKSYIPIVAAVALVMESESYMAASTLFILGWLGRVVQKIEGKEEDQD